MATDPDRHSDDGAASEALARILKRFLRYHPERIDLSLDRVHRLLADLGNPQDALPPVIHIAGTNGKGSVAAFLAAALEVAGKTVSVYTSPHLVRFAERFHIAGETLSDETLLALFEEVEKINAGQAITEFEITTAAAFLAMARAPADVVILETGLGGRFDATNVVNRPMATIITPIGLDHTAFLGPDIATIAGEKAAIQKHDVPSIVAPQRPEAAAVITAAAAAVGAPLHRAGTEWTITPTDDGGGRYRHGATDWPLPPPGLPGRHQLDNAATAAACLEICALPGMTRDAIAIGIRNATWPGRMEWVQRGPLPNLLPQGWELWLDAGHNPAAAVAIADTFKALNARDPRPLHLVFSLLSDKDVSGFLMPFRDLVASVTAVQITGEARARDGEDLVAQARDEGFAATLAPSIEAALTALGSANGSARVLITGSHLLLGETIRANADAGQSWLDQTGGGHYCAH
ncbi:MAG: bifunctional folylpolyglutamate synthase/dihydrofolate synthase [Proteobacteria bacterium]|nr:bifunctional folylpolyglutamate synthase/dihydrofolate synthase [Pseudomonadota bacterium]